jgi:hypothetical protein
MTRIPRLIVAAGVAGMVALPPAAVAQPPTVELVPVNDVQVFAGADSPCPFDVTFTGSGTVRLTTYYDNAGTPIGRASTAPSRTRSSASGRRWSRTGRRLCIST